MKAEKGFTLLEIMIALAVFATLAAALMSASQYVLGQSARVEARLFGAWLADKPPQRIATANPATGAGAKNPLLELCTTRLAREPTHRVRAWHGFAAG